MTFSCFCSWFYREIIFHILLVQFVFPSLYSRSEDVFIGWVFWWFSVRLSSPDFSCAARVESWVSVSRSGAAHLISPAEFSCLAPGPHARLDSSVRAFVMLSPLRDFVSRRSAQEPSTPCSSSPRSPAHRSVSRGHPERDSPTMSRAPGPVSDSLCWIELPARFSLRFLRLPLVLRPATGFRSRVLLRFFLHFLHPWAARRSVAGVCLGRAPQAASFLRFRRFLFVLWFKVLVLDFVCCSSMVAGFVIKLSFLRLEFFEFLIVFLW
jgi:hypothetical protein